MELNKLIANLERLSLKYQPTHTLLDLTKLVNQELEKFNVYNERTFVFVDLNSPSSNIYINNEQKKKFGNYIFNYLSQTITYLGHNEKIKDISHFQANAFISLTSNCLDTIRLISRDTKAIDSFDNNQLLGAIQQLAQLDYDSCLFVCQSETEITIKIKDIELITLKALKSISNLIYNSKFAQDYYSNKSNCLKIVEFVKYFDANVIQNDADSTTVDIYLFKLKVLFLLTVFNKELREKMRDEFQFVPYLVKILDRIQLNRMKENKSLDYCYLKQIDVSFLIEILKVLYNLTMDIENVRSNAVSILNLLSTQSANINHQTSQSKDTSDNITLSNLVCILRDLFVCKLDDQGFEKKNKSNEYLLLDQTNLNDLHSNIINLLTNIPTNYLSELIYKNETKIPDSETEFSMAREFHRIKREFRLSNLKIEEHSEDFINLIKKDQDLDFKGDNMEAVVLILSFMSQHACNYINKINSTNKTDIRRELTFSNPNIDSIDHLYPVLMLLSLMCKTNKKIHKFSRMKVLPPLKKNDLISLPQKGLTIRNRLCKLMTDPNIQLKRLSAQFLFILCKENVNKLVKYTGFGNAAGLLAEAGLMLSPHGDKGAYSSDSNDSESGDYKKYIRDINPITGRIELSDSSDSEENCATKNGEEDSLVQKPIFKKANKKDIFKGLTEEQKEYEAMKLVEAFDKLTRLGSGSIKPATIGADGRPVELEHVLQLHEMVQKNQDEEKL